MKPSKELIRQIDFAKAYKTIKDNQRKHKLNRLKSQGQLVNTKIVRFFNILINVNTRRLQMI